MRRVNLMSEERLLMQDRRRRRVIRWGAACGGLLGLLIWIGVFRVQLRTIDEQINDITGELIPLRRQSQLLDRLEQEHVRLGTEFIAIERLRDPVPPAAILASLTGLFPDEAILTSIAIEIARPTVEDGLQGIAGPAPSLRIVLEGDAATDVAIAELIGHLGQSDLFQSVHLEDSHEINLGGQLHYRFRLSMESPAAESGALVQAGP